MFGDDLFTGNIFYCCLISSISLRLSPLLSVFNIKVFTVLNMNFVYVLAVAHVGKSEDNPW